MAGRLVRVAPPSTSLRLVHLARKRERLPRGEAVPHRLLSRMRGTAEGGGGGGNERQPACLAMQGSPSSRPRRRDGLRERAGRAVVVGQHLGNDGTISVRLALPLT